MFPPLSGLFGYFLNTGQSLQFGPRRENCNYLQREKKKEYNQLCPCVTLAQPISPACSSSSLPYSRTLLQLYLKRLSWDCRNINRGWKGGLMGGGCALVFLFFFSPKLVGVGTELCKGLWLTWKSWVKWAELHSIYPRWKCWQAKWTKVLGPALRRLSSCNPGFGEIVLG